MNRSIGAAALILAGLSAWMLSGVFSNDSETVTTTTADAPMKAPTKVQVLHSLASPVQRLVRVQGQIEANRVLQLKAEVEGQVESLPVSEGEPVSTDTLLVQLAEDFRPAQLAEAQARLKQRRSDLAASKKLREKGLGAENTMIAAEAEVQAAEAALAQAEYQLEHTRLVAPFSGVLNRLMVEVGDFIEKGQAVAELVDDHSLIVSGQVPQHSVAGLHSGQEVMVEVATGDDGEPLRGTLKFVSATAEQTTRSYYVEVNLPNPGQGRLIGLSATLLLPVQELSGHWVPSSALGLASNGGLQVKIVGDDQQVAVVPVEMIRTERDGFWIAGLPYDATIITVGQDFVSAGETVEAVTADNEQQFSGGAAVPIENRMLSARQQGLDES